MASKQHRSYGSHVCITAITSYHWDIFWVRFCCHSIPQPAFLLNRHLSFFCTTQSYIVSATLFFDRFVTVFRFNLLKMFSDTSLGNGSAKNLLKSFQWTYLFSSISHIWHPKNLHSASSAMLTAYRMSFGRLQPCYLSLSHFWMPLKESKNLQLERWPFLYVRPLWHTGSRKKRYSPNYITTSSWQYYLSPLDSEVSGRQFLLHVVANCSYSLC